MSKKVTVWLAREKRSLLVQVYLKAPVLKVRNSDCGCGMKEGCPNYGSSEITGRFIEEFCVSGLRRAGISVRKNEILKLTITIDKPKSTKKPTKKK